MACRNSALFLNINASLSFPCFCVVGPSISISKFAIEQCYSFIYLALILKTSPVECMSVFSAPIFIQNGIRERLYLSAFDNQNRIIFVLAGSQRPVYLVFVACWRGSMSHYPSKISLKHFMCYQAPWVESFVAQIHMR